MHCVGEANKLIAEYKYKLTKCEQEIASLQASLARSETQVIRYKTTADAAEKIESELKIERRKLQREVNMHEIATNSQCCHLQSNYMQKKRTKEKENLVKAAILKKYFDLSNIILAIDNYTYLG